MLYQSPDNSLNVFLELFKNSMDEYMDGEPYLLRTPKCRISTYHYFNREFRTLYKPIPYIPCADQPLLTKIVYYEAVPYLLLTGNEKGLGIRHATSENISCCYAFIWKDTELRISTCINFEEGVRISHPEIQVMCFGSSHKIYENVHYAVTPKVRSKKRWKNSVIESKEQPYSVLILGIDSVSRMNLMRTMPKADDFMDNHNFSSLRGYSKISAKSVALVNLLALLSGGRQTIPIESPRMLFSRLKKLGYTTAYGEDIPKFNLEGNLTDTIDFHLENYMLSARRLESKFYECSGPTFSGERVLEMARDFTVQLHDVPTFGLFWIHTFTHDSVNMLAAMDDTIVKFLQSTVDYLNNTFFFVLSDEGFVFEVMRNTDAGWLEERLPFFRLRFPANFHQEFPMEYVNFRTRAFSLTTPYDVYMTLQDIIQKRNKTFRIEPSVACPKCISLFSPPNLGRTCKDAGISRELCVCHAATFLSTKDELVVQASKFVVSAINKFITYENSIQCEFYSLDKIRIASQVDESESDSLRHTRIMPFLELELNPGAVFRGRIPIDYKTFKVSQVGHSFKLIIKQPRKCVGGKKIRQLCYCKSTKSFWTSLLP